MEPDCLDPFGQSQLCDSLQIEENEDRCGSLPIEENEDRCDSLPIEENEVCNDPDVSRRGRRRGHRRVRFLTGAAAGVSTCSPGPVSIPAEDIAHFRDATIRKKRTERRCCYRTWLAVTDRYE